MASSGPVTTSPSPAIACQGLVKRYGDLAAVRGLDLEVRVGECFGLLGPNGAGKTTTIEILEGLIEPTAGEVRVLGMSWDKDARDLRGRLGITLQETHLQDKLTVRETVQLFRSFYRLGRGVDDVLRGVSLEDKKHARYETLSGGQKQRLAVACALVGNPDLLFLDEPTTGLDPQSRRNLWDLVVGFRAEGGTILITTHYMDEAERLCDRVGIMDHGTMIALGTPRELIASLVGREVVDFATSSPIDEASLDELPGVHAARPVADGYALAVEQIHVSVPALLALLARQGASLTRLSTHKATLEDVFVYLTGRQLRE
ncbi:MAG TPA: ABC transporter ATP-binding protein [Polyangiaceae bacterium]|nr:ABC transporter ATP-binding protein [Polyangiaceae bacterium]